MKTPTPEQFYTALTAKYPALIADFGAFDADRIQKVLDSWTPEDVMQVYQFCTRPDEVRDVEPLTLLNGEQVSLWPIPDDRNEFVELSHKLTQDLYGETYAYLWPEEFDPLTKAPVKVVCPYHGEFYMVPENHIIEAELCPACNSRWFKAYAPYMTEDRKINMVKNKPENAVAKAGVLYVLKSVKDGLFKVGVAVNAEKRLKTLRKSLPDYDLQIHKLFTAGIGDFKSATRTEKALHQLLKVKGCHRLLSSLQDGSTEFFEVDETELLDLIATCGGVEVQ